MTGAGLHILDAFLDVIGPLRRVHGQLLVRKPPPVPRDTAALLIEFANGVSGMLATVRASPFYWRVHVFGDKGSAESLDEHELVVRKGNAKPERLTLPPVDALKIELEVFARRGHRRRAVSRFSRRHARHRRRVRSRGAGARRRQDRGARVSGTTQTLARFIEASRWSDVARTCGTKPRARS